MLSFVVICLSYHNSTIQTTKAGLLIPSASQDSSSRNKQDPVFATILATNSNTSDDNKFETGSVVVFEGFAASEVEFGDRELMFVREKDILAILME